MNDLIRADSEYQKEIRRRQFNDRAKIGLLVGMNLQQFHTNQLLTHNLDVACQTNTLLGQISRTLDQVAGMQATHFEQVQRERQLKEVMYQFDKFLAESEQCGDPVAAAYGMKRLFEVIDRPGHSFTTADLADLKDKRRFDTLLSRGKSILRALPKEHFDELDEFEKLLGIYLQRREEEFDPDAAFPKMARLTLPPDLEFPPGIDDKAQSGFLNWYKSTWLGQRSIFVQGPAWLYSGFLLIPLYYLVQKDITMWKRFLSGGPKADTRLQEWEARRAKHEKKLVVENQRIDTHNASVEENRKKAKRLVEATMADMRSLINGFLKQHPAIQRFVAPV